MADGRGPAGAGGLAEPAIRGQLARLVASPQFAHSDRLVALLRFVVGETLAGRAADLKETKLGLEALARPAETYDPAIDPIVRVQMGRLRKRLASYYDNEGAADPILIDVPKGGYVPRFRARSAAETDGPVVGADGAPPDHRLRLAVLPFVDMSREGENEFFSDGLTEELINALARDGSLHVVARTSSFQFKRQARDIREIGRQLGVGKVLEGSVRSAGSRVRVTVQLIDVADGCHLWSERYEREITGIFAIQDEIAEAILGALRAQVGGGERSALPRSQTGRIEAYNHYLQGRFLWNRRTEQGLRAGLEHFAEAVRLDPGYARAYSGIADCHLMLGMSAAEAPAECMPRARVAALRALELDQGLAEAHASLAAVENCYDWDWGAADSGYRRALKLDPGHATSRHWYAVFRLAPAGKLAEAVDHMESAIALDPLSQPILADRALVSCFRGKPEVAVEQSRRALELDPNFHRPFWFLGLGLTELGEFREAEAALRRGLDLCSGRAFKARLLGTLGHCLARAGAHDRAVDILGELGRLGDGGYAPAFEMAQVHASLGDARRALDCLERAIETRGSFAIFLDVWPSLAPLRSEPRFRRLLGSLGLSR